MKIYCSCCDKVQPVRVDDCLDAKTNEPFQDIVCAECNLVIASGTEINGSQVQPCAGRNCGSTNPNLHSVECFEDYEKATGMGREQAVWRNAALRVGEDLCSVGPFGYYDMTAQQWLDWALGVVTVHAPLQPRKPLTVEQIIEIIHPIVMADKSEEMTDYEIARAIEQAHGIKEQP